MKFDEPLPTGWVLTSCSEFCSGRNQTFNPTRAAEDEFALYSVPSHETGKPETVRASDIGSTKQFVSAGDTLISKINPRLNRTWVVGRHPGRRIIASTEWIVFNQSPEFIPHFLAYFLQQGVVRDFLSHNASGVGGSLTRVRASIFEQVPFPLPPLAEQERIVAKIEELFSELEAGEESLRVARRQLGVYRQSLLKQAFEGKLTAQWRTQNPGKLESPAQLLARIQFARQTRYEQQLKDWELALAKWEKGDRSSSKPRRPSTPEAIEALPTEIQDDMAQLPSSWFWGQLGSMTLGVEYGTAAKSSETGECPVIRMGNLQGGEIDWGDLVFTSDETEIADYRLAPGDVLFNRTNSPELVGKTAIYRGNRPAVFAGYLIRVNQISSVVCSGYLNYFLNSGVAREYGNSVKTDGVNQSNINGAKLAGYPFPYCSLPEQQEIVRLLDEQFDVIDQNEREIDAALQRSEALRQSILKEAFTGRLVPQDPSNEPASVLLNRIRKMKVGS